MLTTVSYEPVIGLEIHAQLQTATKIFCGCPTAFGAAPNTAVCPVCLGFPGALPVLNRAAVDLAVRAALALGCDVHEQSVFARKNYFYPDLPKGYQISQYERPLATGGGLEIQVDGASRAIRLTRIHMEEDAGKSLHEGFPDSERRTYLDYNRAGVPLIEIVTEPDFRAASEAAAFFDTLRRILVWLGVNDGNMEEGSLRCDANVSIRRRGDTTLGTKAEVKNVNSFRYLQKALEYEIERQIDVVEHGGRVVQETRLFDSAQGRTYSMRSKEEAHDYRYFPEPDLPPVVVDAQRLGTQRSALPELPDARQQRFERAYALPAYDAALLTETRAVADYFEAVAAACGNAKAASNWIMGEVLRALKARGVAIAELPIGAADLAGLITLVDRGTISHTVAKDVFAKMLESGRSAQAVVDAENLRQVDDRDTLGAIVRDTIAANPGAVEQIRKGRNNAFGFLVGAVMKATKGTADPRLVNALIQQALDTESSS